MAKCEKLQFYRGEGDDVRTLEVIVCIPDVDNIAIEDCILDAIIKKYEGQGWKHFGSISVGHVDEIYLTVKLPVRVAK